MFKKQQGCTKEVIDTHAGYTVDVWVPPLGYGFNFITGEIEKTDIIKRSTRASQQYWERLALPEDFRKKRAIEKAIQIGDEKRGREPNPDHIDNYLEDIRAKHWTYRLCGVWVYMNGTPVYITGEHWFYMNWCYMDFGGYPEYRDADRRRYYFQEYCVWDDRCAGIIEGSNRRSGKSYRSAWFLMNYVSMTHDSKGGIQSKTNQDAGMYFNSKVVVPFKKLPDFFQPETDVMGGDKFRNELPFKKMTRRGKAALEDMDDLGLNSIIDYRSSEEYSYDSYKLNRAVQDEVGKPSDADPYKRWGIIKECLIVGKKIIGKAVVTTTPEEMPGMDMENSPFYKLWHESKPSTRDGNGRTASWLYAYYIPAWENIEVDKFGMPLKEKNIEFIMNARAANKKKGQKKYLDEMKKHTITEDEMFIATLDGNCLFNEVNLSERMDTLAGVHDHYTAGDFEWENGERDTKVVFVPKKNGKWKVLNYFISSKFESNVVDRRGDMCRPRNEMNYTMGVDPFDHDNVESGKGSKGAIVVKQKYNPFERLETNKAAICIYVHRASTAPIFYEDAIMTCTYFGCDVLFETQKIGIKNYFANRGYFEHFIYLAGRQDVGVASSPEMKQYGVELIGYDVDHHIESFFFMEILNDLAIMDIKKTEKYDLAMAYLYACVADASRLIKHKKGSTVQEIKDILPHYLLN